jgi:hypothetical protein
MSANGIEILRHRDLIGLVELSALDQHTLTLAEIDSFLVEPLQPGMLMLIGEEEEQPLGLHAAAIDEDLVAIDRFPSHDPDSPLENRKLGRKHHQI